MARLPRFAITEQPQHVIQRGNNRCPIFQSDGDRREYLDWLADACGRVGAQLHAYVLMTNHVHLLMSPLEAKSIGSVMQSVGGRYVPWFNRRYARTGTLWEGRYRATLIDSDRYLFSCHRYIELNPVRAGIVRFPKAYPWSSYGANALGSPDPIITPHPRYLALGRQRADRLAAYRDLFASALSDDELGAIRESTNKAWALGDPKADYNELNRRAHRLSRTGRPKRRLTPFPGNGV